MPVPLTHYLLSNLWQSCIEEPFMDRTTPNNASNNNTGELAEFREEFEIRAIPEMVDRRVLDDTRKDGLLAI